METGPLLREEQVYRGNPNELVCGVDLGGTKIVVALVRGDGKVVDQREIRDHRSKRDVEVVAAIGDRIEELLRDQGTGIDDLEGIGIGTAGHVDWREGVVITNSNLPGFSRYPLGQVLRERFDTRVAVDNDANAQAYAEHCFGSGQGFPTMAFVTVSTGIGAGLVIEGKLYRGVTGTAGEIGHTIVNPHSSLRCGCGNYGCLMAHASGLALPQVVRQKLLDPELSTNLDFSSLDDSRINGELIEKGLREGDELCTAVVKEYAHYMGIGIQNLFQVFNPGVVVIGGGLTAWGDVYLNRIRSTFRNLARDMMSEPMEIRLSTLGRKAAVVGAAALVLEPR
jgi:glucokinase